MQETDPYRPPSAALEPGRDEGPGSPVKSTLFAVLSGLVIDFLGTQVASGIAMVVLGPRLVPGDPSTEGFALELVKHPLYYWPMFAVGLALVVAAGYVAGRLADHRPALYGGIAGLSSLVPVLLLLGSTGLVETAAPRWFDLASILFHVPVACLGGWLAGERGGR